MTTYLLGCSQVLTMNIKLFGLIFAEHQGGFFNQLPKLAITKVVSFKALNLMANPARRVFSNLASNSPFLANLEQ